MRAVRAVARLLKGQPVSLESRLEELETRIERRLDHIERSIELFQDVILKLHSERQCEQRPAKKIAQEIKEHIYIPIKNEINEITQEILNDGRVRHDDIAARNRTIAWMRRRLGLPSQRKRK